MRERDKLRECLRGFDAVNLPPFEKELLRCATSFPKPGDKDDPRDECFFKLALEKQDPTICNLVGLKYPVYTYTRPKCLEELGKSEATRKINP